MDYLVTVEPDVNVYVHEVNPFGRKTIFFIHGWPLNHRAFEYQFNELPKLDYRCIGMDIRGFGYSDKPWTGYDYDRLADDVRGVIDAMRLEDIILAGHSMGGAIAARYMSRYDGDGVSKLALLGAAVPSVTKQPDFPLGIPKEDVTRLIQIAANDRPKMLKEFGDMFFFQYITQPLSDWFFSLGLQAAGWATIQAAITFRDETLFSDLEKINVPTLILHGIHDRVCQFPLALAMHQGIRDSKLVPFEYSGHALFYEERDKLNRELANFID